MTLEETRNTPRWRRGYIRCTCCRSAGLCKRYGLLERRTTPELTGSEGGDTTFVPDKPGWPEQFRSCLSTPCSRLLVPSWKGKAYPPNRSSLRSEHRSWVLLGFCLQLMYRFNWWVYLPCIQTETWGSNFQAVSYRNECLFCLEHVEQRDICLSACTNAKVPMSVVQVAWSGFLSCGWCMRQLLSCPCSDWLLFGAGSLATLQLLIEPPWVLTHLCATFSLGPIICLSFSHFWKPHYNPFRIRPWSVLYLEIVALSDFINHLFISVLEVFVRCVLLSFLYLLFCKSRISCAWSCRKWTEALHTAGRWDSSTPSSSASVEEIDLLK